MTLFSFISQMKKGPLELDVSESGVAAAALQAPAAQALLQKERRKTL
jgi:hypothetical protein